MGIQEQLSPIFKESVTFVSMQTGNKKSFTLKEATLKLMQFCAYRDRSQKEVEEKLKEMRMIPEASEKIIIQLMQEDFLNEERFARSFVRGKFRIKKWGRIKIKQELKLRGISKPIIKLALTEIDELEYWETLELLAQKKKDLIKEPNIFKKRKKLNNYLLQKGYENQMILEVVHSIIS